MTGERCEKFRWAGVFLVFATALASPAAAQECSTNIGYRVAHIGGRVVALWYPTKAPVAVVPYSSKFSGTFARDAPASTACGGPVPLVVFSHGDLGCALQSVVFTEELARRGYVVAAPDHADAALCHTLPPRRNVAAPKQPGIFSPQNWDEDSRTDRRDDIENIIKQLLANPEFGPIIDSRKIGLAGHSLGGYTVVGIAGGWRSWLDPRIGAVLAMSPYVMPFQTKNTLENVRVPIMYQGGTSDIGITPFLKGNKGAYAMSNPPKYFVELRDAAHFAWVDCGREHLTDGCFENIPNMRLITEYGMAFFDRYLKGLREPLLEERKNPQLADYEFRE